MCKLKSRNNSTMSASPETVSALDASDSQNTSAIQIYHNPQCSKSRATLALIREAGFEPEIIDYLKTPPDRQRLTQLLSELNEPPSALIRTNEAAFRELGLGNDELSSNACDAALIDAMLSHPILINRPIVKTLRGARLCRPPETVREILP